MIKNVYFKKYLIFVISLISFSIDQGSKQLAQSYLVESNPQILIPGIIKLNLVRNYGAAFSLLTNASSFLSVVSLTTSVLIIFYIFKKSKLLTWEAIGLAFLLGGSLGNGFDRWVNGYVYDFLDLIPINFPVFNFADISINIGVICIILNSLWKQHRIY